MIWNRKVDKKERNGMSKTIAFSKSEAAEIALAHVGYPGESEDAIRQSTVVSVTILKPFFTRGTYSAVSRVAWYDMPSMRSDDADSYISKAMAMKEVVESCDAEIESLIRQIVEENQ